MSRPLTPTVERVLCNEGLNLSQFDLLHEPLSDLIVEFLLSRLCIGDLELFFVCEEGVCVMDHVLLGMRSRYDICAGRRDLGDYVSVSGRLEVADYSPCQRAAQSMLRYVDFPNEFEGLLVTFKQLILLNHARILFVV